MKKSALLLLLCFLCITLVSADQYFVTMNNNPTLQKASLSTQSNTINTQEPIINKENIIYTFNNTKKHIVELSKKEVEILEKNHDVIIEKRYTFQKTLDVSIPQIDANDTWILQQNQTNLTGIGQTVCVIDTGVNYSHINLGGCYGNNTLGSNCTIIGGWDYCADGVTCTTEDWNPMDVDNHGTHVTGIITSNHSTYKGVAPEVKIVMVKALNDTGTGFVDSINKSINWCVNNASLFNISVITMSLGGTYYENSYCDSSWLSSFTPAIHRANQANITVIASAGNCDGTQNCGGSAGISAPACISGVIPAGAVNSADTIWYQRGSLFQVLAPGRTIDSTSITGGFESKSGTSMSAPHVAGLVSLLAQFYKLQTNKSLDNQTIKNALNNTNTFILDSANTGLTYPRINVLQSLYYLDSSVPNVTLISPTNGTINSSINQTFIATLTDFALQNVTFYLWNATGLENQTTESITGQQKTFQIQVNNISQNETTIQITTPTNNFFTNQSTMNISCAVAASVYKWTMQGIDHNDNTFTAPNYTFSLNNSGTNLSNITFTVYNETSLENTTTTQISGSANTSTINYSFQTQGTYTLNCTAQDNNSQAFNSQTFTVTYDAMSPNITIATPLPTSETSNSIEKIFYFNVSDTTENATCSLQFSNITQETKTITNYSQTQNFTQTLTPATYHWKINCSDQANNQNESEENSFTITAVTTNTNNNGGGGGGGASSTSLEGTKKNPYSKQTIAQGKTITFTKEKQIYFTNEHNENHSITLNTIANKTITITVASTPQTITLKENETIKLNITDKQTLDLQITVNKITSISAEVIIKTINEPNQAYIQPGVNRSNEPTFHTMEDQNSTTQITQKNLSANKTKIIIAILVIAIILAVGIFIFKTKKHIKRKSVTKKDKEHGKKAKNSQTKKSSKR